MSTITIESLLENNSLNEIDLDLEIESVHYLEISRCLTKWKVLGFKLGFDNRSVTAIENDHPQEEDRKVEFLVHLKQKLSFKATYGLLVKNLLKIEMADDAQSLCNHLKGKFCFTFDTGKSHVECIKVSQRQTLPVV